MQQSSEEDPTQTVEVMNTQIEAVSSIEILKLKYVDKHIPDIIISISSNQISQNSTIGRASRKTYPFSASME